MGHVPAQVKISLAGWHASHATAKNHQRIISTNQVKMEPTNSSTVASQRRRKRMRTQSRLTPWKDGYELDTVGRALLLAMRLLRDATMSCLTEHEQADLQHALHRVNMWKARSDQGRIPHSMETTYCLAQVAWRDVNGSCCSSMELRMAYATAIMRGVNGLADVLQQNRAYAASVASLCEQIGLPGWLVDIRHEAAHNDLPTLPVLRLATSTFLGYLEERYWIPMANSRHEMRQAAVDLLVKYKETCKKKTTTDATAKKEDEATLIDSSTDEESESNDTNNDSFEKSLGTNRNRFAVFSDTAEPPKSKKQRNTEEAKAKQKAAAAATKEAVHSALHFVRVFVRDVPIDVGYQVALSFLVWGGIGEAPSGRGVLIPGSPASFPASDEGVERIRLRYKPLILVLCRSWPGFAHALLVHLVDHVLSIEATLGDNVDEGSKRKLFFLTSWIRFLLSRELHVRNDKTIGLFKKQDLSEKRPAKWTKAEREFMKSPAPYSTLSQARFPLNSLCDRCVGTGVIGVENGSHDLSVLFSDILAEYSVANHGVRDRETSESIAAETETSTAISLHGMDQVLQNTSHGVTDTSKDFATAVGEPSASVPSNALKGGWTQCQTWDACPIGSLPGRL